LVNDKSTDGSSEILSKYKHLKNVKIIDHKTNKGLSATRNTGVAHAMGE
jgi:glycosyltransferase involved in cell wall biosynthesis